MTVRDIINHYIYIYTLSLAFSSSKCVLDHRDVRKKINKINFTLHHLHIITYLNSKSNTMKEIMTITVF